VINTPDDAIWFQAHPERQFRLSHLDSGNWAISERDAGRTIFVADGAPPADEDVELEMFRNSLSHERLVFESPLGNAPKRGRPPGR
jgi:hypothetical protein